jgi:hypothetical protein
VSPVKYKLVFISQKTEFLIVTAVKKIKSCIATPSVERCADKNTKIFSTEIFATECRKMSQNLTHLLSSRTLGALCCLCLPAELAHAFPECPHIPREAYSNAIPSSQPEIYICP